MEKFAAISTLAHWYVGLGCVYLVCYWMVTFKMYKAKPHRDSLLALGATAVALWQVQEIGIGTAGYTILFMACVFVTGAIMVAGSVTSKAKAQAAFN